MPCPNHPAAEAGLERCQRCRGRFCPDCFVVLRDAPYCSACKEELVRDLRSGVEADVLPLGSIGRRFGALWLDGFLTGMASYAVLIPLMILVVAVSGSGDVSSGSEPGGPSDMVAAFLGLLVYPVLLGIPFVYESWMLQAKSQTLGKMALGLRVVTPSGGAISTGQAWGRTAAKLVLAGCVGITYIPAFMTRERTTLHDMIAGTRVVRVLR
jgi:uncharacterized RDD family membrane protein YckC